MKKEFDIAKSLGEEFVAVDSTERQVLLCIRAIKEMFEDTENRTQFTLDLRDFLEKNL